MAATEQSDWLDGPAFVEWLYGRVSRDRISVRVIGETNARVLGQWRMGRLADVYVVDRVLIACGLMLSEVPDELYVNVPTGPRLGTPQAIRERAVALYRAGASPTRLGAEVGVSPGTIWKWANRST